MSQLELFVTRAIKYLIEGVVVAIVAIFIPKKALPVEDVVILALTAAAVFSLLDVFVPEMGSSARQGAGMGLGFKLVGFPM
jgi:hypothetical protein